MLRTRDRRHRRTATGRDDHLRRFEQRVPDTDLVRRDERRVAAEQIDLSVAEVAFVDAVQPRDVGVTRRPQRRPIVPAQRDIEAVVHGIVSGMGDLRGVPHHLLRHTAHVDAGAAEACRLHDRHARTVLRRALRTGEPAAATADHHQVVSRSLHSDILHAVRAAGHGVD